MVAGLGAAAAAPMAPDRLEAAAELWRGWERSRRLDLDAPPARAGSRRFEGFKLGLERHGLCLEPFELCLHGLGLSLPLERALDGLAESGAKLLVLGGQCVGACRALGRRLLRVRKQRPQRLDTTRTASSRTAPSPAVGPTPGTEGTSLSHFRGRRAIKEATHGDGRVLGAVDRGVLLCTRRHQRWRW
jgi:hypothetical protein